MFKHKADFFCAAGAKGVSKLAVNRFIRSVVELLLCPLVHFVTAADRSLYVYMDLVITNLNPSPS